ncbi:MAG TPA: kelch repeat-containing protein [Nitrososphaeraceae archaeon]|nr:kelch repeat-containing protein [Nitrososphaeraceae archaeon]
MVAKNPLFIVIVLSVLAYAIITMAYTTSASPQSHLSESYWTNGSKMPTPRSAMAAAILDDKIYVAGGQGGKVKKDKIVEVYDIKSDQWTKVTSLPEPLDHLGMASYDGKLYVVGGAHKYGYSNKLLIYDPSTNNWTEGKPMPGARTALTANFIDDKLYAVGGVDDVHNVVATNFEYDPVNDTWTEKAPMPTARHHLTSSVVDGKLYVIGGRIYGDGIPEPIAKALSNFDVNEMYDPATDTWTKLKPMPSKRSGLASASMGNYIYVFGGEKVNGTFENNERYDTTRDIWTEEPPLPTPRLGLKAVTYDSKIYVIGGKTWYDIGGEVEILHVPKR